MRGIGMTSTASIRLKALAGEGENLASRIAYTDGEREGVHKQKQRLAKRGKIGGDWDGRAANDNVAWPLATALIREGNTELLKAAMYYRKVHDTAKSDARLGGSSVSIENGVALDRHTQIRSNGSLAHKHVRQSDAADVDIPAKRRTATCSEVPEKAEVGYTNVPKAWKGDEPVNNMIDAQVVLGQLRSALGPLVEPLEMAVVDGATYEAIGYSLREAHKRLAISTGRAMVHLALISIRGSAGEIKRSSLA
jgi:hypothetical protein